MYATESASSLINSGTINLNADNTTGVYLDNGAKGINTVTGTIKSASGLKNVIAVQTRVENTDSINDLGQFDVITSRAFASVIDFVRLSENVLKPDGFFAAMKGVMPADELNELEQFAPQTWQHEIIKLNVPQLDAERHLVKLNQK